MILPDHVTDRLCKAYISACLIASLSRTNQELVDTDYMARYGFSTYPLYLR